MRITIECAPTAVQLGGPTPYAECVLVKLTSSIGRSAGFESAGSRSLIVADVWAGKPIAAVYSCSMAGTLWTIEYFGCPNCGLRDTATREPHPGKRSGSFSCEVCGVEVHAWSGNHDFFGWKVEQAKSPVFGKRWG
jgi:hypothetical protein